MVVRRLRDVIEAHRLGQVGVGQVRKTPSSSWVNGRWVDFTPFGGQPQASFYASTPLTFAPMARSTHGGWDHGPPVAPATKYLKRVCVQYFAQSLCGYMIDILGYYPFWEPSSPGEDVALDNTIAKAPRHGNGEGVRAYILSVGANNLNPGNTLTITYTNSDGVPGRTASAAMQAQLSANGCIMNSTPVVGGLTHPFFPLQGNDRGIREVTHVRVDGPGDGGALTVVLCREVCRLPPIVGLGLSEPAAMSAPVEHDFLRTTPLLPVIDDDAYLSAVAIVYHSASPLISLSTLFGEFSYFWF